MADCYTRRSRWRIPETDGGDQACEDEEQHRRDEATAFKKAEDAGGFASSSSGAGLAAGFPVLRGVTDSHRASFGRMDAGGEGLGFFLDVEVFPYVQGRQGQSGARFYRPFLFVGFNDLLDHGMTYHVRALEEEHIDFGNMA